MGDCQPYARHYLHGLGLSDSDPVGTHFRGADYMAWNQRAWAEFAAGLGVDREKVRPVTHGDAFGVWLADRCGCGVTS